MITITLDFETYYDVNYSLTKMPTPVYVNHDDFKVWGVGIKVEDQETVWLQPDEIEAEFATYNWEDVALVCHNTPIDAYILTQRYSSDESWLVSFAKCQPFSCSRTTMAQRCKYA